MSSVHQMNDAGAARNRHARALGADFLEFARTRFARNPLSWGVATLVFLGAFLLNMRQIAGASLWFDETSAISASQQPVAFLLSYVLHSHPNMALYYLLLHFWLETLGKFGVHPTETASRLPSVFFGALGSAGVFALGRRYWSWVTGIVAAIIYSLSNFALMVAQQARSYSMVMFFLIVAWYLFFGALSEREQRQTRWWWTLYTLAITLAFYAHLYTFFAMIAQYGGLAALLVIPGAWQSRARSAIRPALISGFATFILIAPLIYGAAHSGGSAWVQPATPTDAYDVFLYQVSDGSQLYLAIQAALILCSVGLALSIWANPEMMRATTAPQRKGSSVAAWLEWRLIEPRPGATLLLIWLILPFGLTYAITQPGLNLHFFFSRYEVIIMPAIALLIGLAIYLLPMRPLQWAASIALVAIALANLPYYYAHAQIQDFRTPITWLQARYQPGDGIICFPARLCSIPTQVYLSAYPGATHLDADSPGSYTWSDNTAIPVTLATVAGYAAHHDRLFLVDAYLGGATNGDSATIRQWLGAHYILSGQVSAGGVKVYFYTPRPPSTVSATG